MSDSEDGQKTEQADEAEDEAVQRDEEEQDFVVPDEQVQDIEQSLRNLGEDEMMVELDNSQEDKTKTQSVRSRIGPQRRIVPDRVE